METSGLVGGQHICALLTDEVHSWLLAAATARLVVNALAVMFK
jgi:hypothetical protein